MPKLTHFMAAVKQGATWVQRYPDGSRSYSTIASSLDGNVLVAAVDMGYVYLSTDGGVSWSEQTCAGYRNWRSVACSSDCSRIIVVGSNAYPYFTNGAVRDFS